MRYKFFTNSRTAWQAMYEEIQKSEECIYLEMYIFVEDIKGEFDFLKLLEEKAKGGVKVKIILDSFGSRGLGDEATERLKTAGAELIFFSSWLHRTHRKILVVDQKVAFVGGVNLHPSTKKWNDLVIRMEGHVASTIVRSFAKTYALCGGTDYELRSLRPKAKFQKTRAWLVEHFPINSRYSLKKMYQESLESAKTSFIFITPYLVPRRWLIGAMHQAVLRGVQVSMLIPKETNHFLVDRMNYFYMSKLSKFGIVFYLAPKMNHAKALIIDRKRAMIGTQNMDPFSFELNSEIGVFIEDLDTVGKLLQITDKWKGESSIFDGQNYKKYWVDYILWPILSLLFFL